VSVVGRRPLLIGAAALAAPAALHAEDTEGFPQRPVRVVVPFPAGGAADTLTRTLMDQLRQVWRQPVVVENLPGAGGNVGAQAAYRAEPDGHTLFASPPGPLVINRYLYHQLVFDPARFVPVTVMAKVPNLVVAGPKLAARSIEELLAEARARPGEITFASQGNGSTSHLTGAMFEALTGTRLVHVPYRGEAPALVDVMAGQVDLMFGNLTAALPQYRGGRLRILAVTDDHRAEVIPEVPTAAEAGIARFISSAWFALAAPPGTPATLAGHISAQAAEALRAPALMARYRELGAEPVGQSPAETAAFFAEEADRWSGVIRFAQVTLD
jgi:tripartite-type tricarboxylate transporter receptor subunit TctC